MNYWDRFVIICALMGAGLAAHGDYIGMVLAIILAAVFNIFADD